ncbi:peptidylprolyl isomerase [Falsiroseomonas selenitidurans]|uniref:Peptidyl-prolyl cis-trans isomerase n=1 Tax=Falsiroseomonas selenitidurans TaxID=2716335 RepID=A0ABX1DYZ4_9PROT|nr:peptidylprolyl isomerase [Falsiroseomonas selenitidurans]NKC30125.1 peptidylprolyl isomerase [Falsiroseomonas selenitidurans]
MSASIAPENTLLLELNSGTVTIELLPDLAPLHVERIRTLASAGFYDNTPFHRVIEGFMAQGGDPTGTGTGGSEHPDLPAEFSPPGKAKFLRGVCGMARTNNPNSANSQFFIMFAPAPSLDGQYTIWGRVVDGMDHVDRIKRGQGPNGLARDPDRIKSLRVGSAAAAAPAEAEAGAEGVDSTPAADA